MSIENCQKPYQQRFKGVENFLRRVAFNLGNTPSQTEVKTISCIPIDVTDLQQKIISLEKQLHEAQEKADKAIDKLTKEKATGNSKPGENPPDIVKNALPESPFTKHPNTVSYCNTKPTNIIKSGHLYCEDCSLKMKRSNVSFLSSALTEPNTSKFDSHRESNNEKANTVYRYKNIFRSRKRKKSFDEKPKLKTHLIYYAHQAADNPFRMNNSRLNNGTRLGNTDEMCLSHLSNVMRRQYDPNEVVKEFSATSNFTKPICRETDQKNKKYESDVCSCCNGSFQNIDNYITNTLYCEPVLENVNHSLSYNNVFYDSNNYDVIPVKEKLNKNVKEKPIPKKKHKLNLEVKCWPENLRAKQTLPRKENYENKIQNNNQYLNPIELEINKFQQFNTEQGGSNISDQKVQVELAKSCYVDCGVTYPKKIYRDIKPQNHEVLRTALQINESVATDEIGNKMQGINESTQLELNSTEDSKVLTLNEIKTVLQSVLEEIKTSKINTSEKTIKKNVVVQKGSSQLNMEGDSVLIGSYTYNKSYNTNPYVASCSRQNPYGQYCLANIPYQPVNLQNFPVFIQPAGKHMCACYYRKCLSKPSNKPATIATSNIVRKSPKASNETEKLIKEIYKSIALNMDYPTRDVSSSEYQKPSSTDNASNKTTEKEIKNENVRTKRDIEVEALLPFQRPVNQSQQVYTAVSTQSEDKSDIAESKFNKHTLKDANDYKRSQNIEYQRSDTIIEDEVDSSESQSDDTVVSEEFKQNVKSKKGFFNQMLKTVKLFKKKKEIRKHEDIQEESDSDDYETVYSEASKRTPRRYTEIPQNVTQKYERRNSPYLEQEYRRRWNEYVTFREKEGRKHSSERPYSRQSSNPRPVYWTNCEARSANVDQDPKKLDQANHCEHNLKSASTRFDWIKKHKLGVNCGEQWKKFILES